MTSTTTSEAARLLRHIAGDNADPTGDPAVWRALRRLVQRTQDRDTLRQLATTLLSPWDPQLARTFALLDDPLPAAVVAHWPPAPPFQTDAPRRVPLTALHHPDLVVQLGGTSDGSGDTTLHFWATTGERLGQWRVPPDLGDVTAMAGGTGMLAVGTSIGAVAVLVLADARPPWVGGPAAPALEVRHRHGQAVRALVCHRDWVASAAADGVRLSDLHTPSRLWCRLPPRRTGRPNRSIGALCVSDQSGVIVASMGDAVVVWHRQTGALLRRLDGVHQNTLRTLHALGGRMPRRVSPVPTRRGPGSTGLAAHNPTPLAVAMLDAHHLVQVTDDGMLAGVRIADGQVFAVDDAGERLVAAGSETPGDGLGTRLLAVGRSVVHRWDVESLLQATGHGSGTSLRTPSATTSHPPGLEVEAGFCHVGAPEILVGHERQLLPLSLAARSVTNRGRAGELGPNAPLVAARFTADGQSVVATDASGLVLVWTPFEARCDGMRWDRSLQVDGQLDVEVLDAVGDLDRQVELHVRGERFVFVVTEGDMTGPLLRPDPASTGSGAVDARGVEAAVVDVGTDARKVSTLLSRLPLTPDAPVLSCFSPDGQILFASDGATFFLISAQSGI